MAFSEQHQSIDPKANAGAVQRATAELRAHQAKMTQKLMGMEASARDGRDDAAGAHPGSTNR